MTEQEIITFCDNLKATMLDAAQKKIPVCMSVKYDTEEIGPESGLIDVLFHGQVIKIKLGRPAALQLAKDEYKRLKMQAAYGGYPFGQCGCGGKLNKEGECADCVESYGG